METWNTPTADGPQRPPAGTAWPHPACVHLWLCGLSDVHTCTRSLTSAVPEVGVAWRVVLAEPLQDLLVVHEPVQRAQEEGVERQVTHLLQLKVSAEMLQPPGALDGVLQGLQGLAVLPKVSGQVLWEEGGCPGQHAHTSVTQMKETSVVHYFTTVYFFQMGMRPQAKLSWSHYEKDPNL